MDAFSPTRQLNNQKLDLILLDIDDFNGLISILKRREENIIQVLDYNLKYRNSSKEEELSQLDLLKTQLKDIEKTRIAKEDQILLKYANLKITDSRQKKLVIKLVNKLIQLNISVKDKLAELDIYDKTKDSYSILQEFEDNLKKLITKQIFQVDLILSYIIEKSRMRLEQQINIDVHQRKTNLQKLEKILLHDHIIHNSPNILQSIDEIGKEDKELLKASLVTKYKNQSLSPIRQRPILQKSQSKEINNDKKELAFAENSQAQNINSYESTIALTTKNNPQKVNEIKKIISNPNSIQEKTVQESLNHKPIQKKDDQLPELNKTATPNANVNNSNTLTQKFSKDKSQKTLISADEANNTVSNTNQSVQSEVIKEVKTDPKFSKTDPWKHYDILKIENKPFPIMSQKNKKNFMEKVYNELSIWNNEVRKTIYKYRLDYMIYSEKSKKKLPSHSISELYNPGHLEIRSQSSTPVATSTQIPRSISTRHGNQIFAQNLRGRVEHVRCQSSFETSVSPNISISQNNSNAIPKSRPGQRVLVLPKLNIFEESYYARPATQSLGTPTSKEQVIKIKNNPLQNDQKSKHEKLELNEEPILVQPDNESEIITNQFSSFQNINLFSISRNFSPSIKDGTSPLPKNIRAFGNILNKINAESFINFQLSKIQGFNINMEKSRLNDLNEKFGKTDSSGIIKNSHQNIRIATSKQQK